MDFLLNPDLRHPLPPGETEPRAVVHLVHGTWPYGPFRRSSSGPPRWFEEGSAFRDQIARIVHWPIEFRVTSWSGANSVLARAAASESLYENLLAVQETRQDIPQVIIAHSHGGTAAMYTVAAARALREIPHVDALICLATPFVFTSEAPPRHRDLFAMSVAGLVASSTGISLNALGFSVAALCIASVVVYLAAYIGERIRSDFFRSAPDALLRPRLHPVERIFLLRATRDEASFALGFAQVIDQLLQRLFGFRYADRLEWKAVTSTYVTCCLSAWLALQVIPRDPATSLAQDIVLLLLSTTLVMCVLFLAPYLLFAIACGFRRPMFWGGSHIIEAEAAPPDVPCSLRSYTGFRRRIATIHDIFEDHVAIGHNLYKGDIRHSLHRDPAVIHDVSRVILDVVLGLDPDWRRSDADRLIREREVVRAHYERADSSLE